jgi:hypothetical protein
VIRARRAQDDRPDASKGSGATGRNGAETRDVAAGDDMEIVFGLVKWVFWGFVGLIVLVVVFGKRVEKKWEYEAKFRDARRREIGEFDIELFRIPSDNTDWKFKAKFVLRHPALIPGQVLRVYLDDELVIEKTLEQAGFVRLGASELCAEIKSPAAGQVVSVRCGDDELFAEALYRD